MLIFKEKWKILNQPTLWNNMKNYNMPKCNLYHPNMYKKMNSERGRKLQYLRVTSIFKRSISLIIFRTIATTIVAWLFAILWLYRFLGLCTTSAPTSARLRNGNESTTEGKDIYWRLVLKRCQCIKKEG